MVFTAAIQNIKRAIGVQVIFILEINLEKVHFLAKYIHFSGTNVFFNPCYDRNAHTYVTTWELKKKNLR